MIYIACPPKYATGGTECLHQLYYEIFKITKSVRIYYYGHDGFGNPTNDRFLKYEVKYVTEIEDSVENLIIVPEINSGISLLNSFKYIKKIVWWLSVDNYFLSNRIGVFKYLIAEKGWNALIKHILKKFVNKLLFQDNHKLALPNFADDKIVHLYQSEYSKLFLVNNNVKHILPLHDYINLELLSSVRSEKKDLILYNPAKGIKMTRKILGYIKKSEKLALKGMNPIQLGETLSEAKIYIDFGNHPGRDKIPREAVINGCIIITNTKGSALNDVDIPIPIKYKLDTDELSPKEIAFKIEDLSRHYHIAIDDFSLYKERVLNERNSFREEVKYLYNDILSHYSQEV